METHDTINLHEALATIEEPFQPLIVGRVNDHKLMVVKVQGEFVWHAHADTDDCFLVLNGELAIDLRDRTVELGPGDLFVVPRGVEHRPRSSGGAEVLLIEPAGTVNTGDGPAGAMTAPARTHKR